MKPYRTAAQCIDWSVECPSIFTRKKPLADKTMRRIALGIKRYVIDNPNPFVIQTSHTGTTGRGSYCWPVDEPTRTISRSNEFAVVTPIVSKYHGQKTDEDSRCSELEKPFATLDTQPRFALVSPTLVSITHDGERRPIDPNSPLPTITTAHRGEIGLVSAFLAKHFGGMVGVEATTPLPTTTQKGCQTQVVAATLVQSGYGERSGQSPRVLDIEQPLGTVVSGGVKHATVAASLIRFNFDDNGVPIDQPLPTVTSNNHAALVYAFLTKYFGTAIGANLNESAPTVTAKDRLGVVTVTVAGEQYVIVDIGMRMLTPRELARAQGFPDTYMLTGTKTSQVARIGNSVCPHVAEAIVRANRPQLSKVRKKKSKVASA